VLQNRYPLFVSQHTKSGDLRFDDVLVMISISVYEEVGTFQKIVKSIIIFHRS